MANIVTTIQPLILAGMLESFIATPADTQLLVAEADHDTKTNLGFFDLNTIGKNTIQYLKQFYEFPEGQSSNTLFLLASIYLILVLLASILNYLSATLVRWIRAASTKEIRGDLVKHLFTLPLSFYNYEKSGDLLSRVINDAMNTAQGVAPLVRSILHHGTLIIIYSIFLFNTSKWMTIAVLFLFLLHYGITRILSHPVRIRERKVFDSTANLSSTLQETFSAIRLIKGFAAENTQFQKVLHKLQNVKRADFQSGLVTELELPSRAFLDAFAIIGVVLIATHQMLIGAMTLQGAVMFIFVGRLLIDPINKFSVNFLWIQSLLAAYDRISTVYNRTTEIIEGKINKVEFSSNLALLDVSFSYKNEVEVLHSINLEISKGEVIALVGPSGSGKSTLLDLLLRFYDPSKGSILIDGTNLKDLRLTPYRHKFGVVSQDTVLFHDSVEENIRLGRSEISKNEIERAATIANAHGFISNLEHGYETIVGDRGVLLSGGQRQRIAIARAIVGNPQILLLDEATSSLDAESEREVQHAIETVLQYSTAVVVAHRLSTIVSADKIVVLNAGEIVDIGHHETLIQTSAMYRNLYELQVNNITG